jgi:hypothetical protein
VVLATKFGLITHRDGAPHRTIASDPARGDRYADMSPLNG